MNGKINDKIVEIEQYLQELDDAIVFKAVTEDIADDLEQFLNQCKHYRKEKRGQKQ